MSNKKFLIIVIVIAIGVFILSRGTNNKSEQVNIPVVSIGEDILIKSHSIVMGLKGAPITIVEFLDPECEACRAMHSITKQLLKEYEGKIKLVIRYMPLHRNSLYAASVLEEARERGKFEEALNILFENQPIWGSHQNPRPDLIPGYLETIGIPPQLLKPEVVIPKHTSKIEVDNNDGKMAGVRGTPTFFVNGIMLNQIGYEPLKNAIEMNLNKQK